MIYTLRRALLMLWVFVATTLSAQNISVASFKLLPNDLTANTYGTSEKDFNGEVAALIKVVTTEQGFVFDGGMVGVVKTKQGVGEMWVYVPHGIKKLTIQHPQLGVLRDYFFPIPIEKARTYEMVLTTGRVETLVTHAVTKQWVVLNVTPADAEVELGDEMLSVDGDGVAEKLMPYGSYNYRVSHSNYHTEAGIITVTAEGKAEKTVTLRPNYGWIKVGGSSDYDGANVYIDNERVGQFPYTSKELKSGTHRVKVVKSMYKTYEQQVTVSDNETTELNVQMVANFAQVTLKADAGCEIWVDGQHKGNEQWSGPLEMGDYTVEVRKPSHRNASEIVHISSTEERTIQLKLPAPIYATLVVSSTPTRAMVYIDGKEEGTTPLLKNNMLVGSHRLEFRKEGYASVTKTINLQEGIENKVSAELTNQQEISIVSNPSGASVSVDGVYKGVTPLSTTLAYGSHTIQFSKNDYRTEVKTVDVDHQTTTVTATLSPVSQEIEITSDPSGASVDINGMYKGTTPLKVKLNSGSHLITLSKKGHKSYSVYRNVPSHSSGDFHFKLEKVATSSSANTVKYANSSKYTNPSKKSSPTYSYKPVQTTRNRPVTNDTYKNLALYVDGYGNAAWGNHRYVYDGGGALGFYLYGINFEMGMTPSTLGFRFGWGFECGKNFLITPQVGYQGTEFRKNTSGDYYYLEGYYAPDYYISYTLGCRAQYCINRFFAAFVTPEYGIDFEEGNAGSFYIRAGLTLNLGL